MTLVDVLVLMLVACGGLLRRHRGETPPLVPPITLAGLTSLSLVGVRGRSWSELPWWAPTAALILTLVAVLVVRRPGWPQSAGLACATVFLAAVNLAVRAWPFPRWLPNTSAYDEMLFAALVFVVGLACCFIFDTTRLALGAVFQHQRVATTLRSARRDGVVTALAVAGCTAMIVAGHPVAGPWIIPLALAPLWTLETAQARRLTVGRSLHDTVQALARVPEVGGYVPHGHGQRVAALSVRLGEAMDCPEDVLRDIEQAALLHDLGQITLGTPIPRGATSLVAPRDQRSIAEASARIVGPVGRESLTDVLTEQATPYVRVTTMESDVPLASRIIKVATAFDDFSEGATDERRVRSALERITLGLGHEYDPAVVRALRDVVLAAPLVSSANGSGVSPDEGAGRGPRRQ